VIHRTDTSQPQILELRSVQPVATVAERHGAVILVGSRAVKGEVVNGDSGGVLDTDHTGAKEGRRVGSHSEQRLEHPGTANAGIVLREDGRRYIVDTFIEHDGAAPVARDVGDGLVDGRGIIGNVVVESYPYGLAVAYGEVVVDVEGVAGDDIHRCGIQDTRVAGGGLLGDGRYISRTGLAVGVGEVDRDGYDDHGDDDG